MQHGIFYVNPQMMSVFHHLIMFLFSFYVKGTQIIPNLTSVLFDQTKWKSPYSFDPQNFLNAQSKFEKPEAFIPFSAGEQVYFFFPFFFVQVNVLLHTYRKYFTVVHIYTLNQAIILRLVLRFHFVLPRETILSRRIARPYGALSLLHILSTFLHSVSSRGKANKLGLQIWNDTLPKAI